MKLIEKMSKELKLNSTYLYDIANRSSYYYKDYSIPKKKGGCRNISQPSPELKTLQYWIKDNILTKMPISKFAFAYNKGDSIKKHASIHSKSRFLFHSDIMAFFPSIHFAILKKEFEHNRELLNKLNLDFDDTMEYICKICFKDDILCIGAVSSPIISNIIMHDFDERLAKYCKQSRYVYSRYADDIYISSSNYIDANIKEYLKKLLLEYQFEINNKKTYFCSSKHRRVVTGIVITNDLKLSVGLNKRKEVKKIVYNKLVKGEGDSAKILGNLAFLKDIEPHTYDKIIIKYSRYCDEDIIKALSK